MRYVANHMMGRARRSMLDGSTGPAAEAYLSACTCDDVLTQSKLVLTRERTERDWLWHLSVSALPRFLADSPAVALDAEIVRAWPKVFFASALRHVDAQEPGDERGRRLGIWHWRLYCNEHWRPIRAPARGAAVPSIALEESAT